MKVASALTILTIGTVIAFAVPSTSTAVTRTPTPTPTPVPVTTVDFGPIKQDIREKGQKLVREIDLNINPKAGNTGCTLRVYKAREKAVVTSEDLFSSVVLLPDINYRGTLTGLNCQKISASKDVNSTKRYYTNLSRMMTTLVRLEKTCKAKYGLSYPPSYDDLGQVNRELNTIPKYVYVCSQ